MCFWCQVAKDIFFFVIAEEIMFYYGHRLSNPNPNSTVPHC